MMFREEIDKMCSRDHSKQKEHAIDQFGSIYREF